ncbi:MAG TPA: hypothetical protein VK661_09345 [Planctomycetota bacterium]|nr:hypothetical protein [Planctomycetota bacterium]
MSVRESFIDLPGDIAWPIDHKEEVPLWGWDRQLWPHLAKADPLALSKILRKRLRARAFAERIQAGRMAGIDGVAILRHLHASDLNEAAARGWQLVERHLALSFHPRVGSPDERSVLNPLKSTG